MKEATVLTCTLVAAFAVSPAFAEDSFAEKKALALETITQRLEKIEAKKDCVVGSENMDELNACKIKLIHLLSKTHPKSMLKGFD